MAEHTSRKHPPVPVIVLVLLLLLGGGTWWWWSSTQAGAATDADALTGTVEANQYQVMPALSGRVTAVRVVEGDTVTEGQELARLDRAALKLQRTQARQGVKAAKAALTNAKDDDDATKADVALARARLRQAEAAVTLTEVQLGYTLITAPRAGTVVSVVTNAGQNAAPGRTMITITDPTDLFVRVFVPETRIGDVVVGQGARVARDSGTSVEGSVSFIASSSEFTPNTVQTREQRVKLVYEIRVRVSDASGTLKAGMPVDVVLG